MQRPITIFLLALGLMLAACSGDDPAPLSSVAVDDDPGAENESVEPDTAESTPAELEEDGAESTPVEPDDGDGPTPAESDDGGEQIPVVPDDGDQVPAESEALVDESTPVESDGGGVDRAASPPAQSDDELPATALVPLENNGSDVDAADVLAIEETVITNSDTVDPMITAPFEAVLNPEDPTELWVRFVGGDPNCTAASARLLNETITLISFELVVGLTQDAPSRSCVEGEFNLRVNLALTFSGAAKTITWSQPIELQAPLVTPDLSTDDFVGLTQDEAEAIADENDIAHRTLRIDQESFAVTEDIDPGRLNFEIDDGIVTSASLG